MCVTSPNLRKQLLTTRQRCWTGRLEVTYKKELVTGMDALSENSTMEGWQRALNPKPLLKPQSLEPKYSCCTAWVQGAVPELGLVGVSCLRRHDLPPPLSACSSSSVPSIYSFVRQDASHS